MTIKKFVLTCMLASAPLIGFAEVIQESLNTPLQSSVPQVQAPQPLQLDTSKLSLASAHSMLFDLSTNTPVFSKNETAVVPIASVTKLMTAMVVLDAKLPMDEVLTISESDKDWLKKTHSRMRVGTQLTRYEFMRLALMSSENRAAAALGRNYPGGLPAFVRAMNAKAQQLHMNHTRFQDSTGLSSGNVSTAEDLVKMVTAASTYPEIHQFTTTVEHTMQANTPRYSLEYHNTNVLVQNEQWDIKVSKTGYTDEAGRCLVMVVNVANRPMAMVFLDAVGKRTTVGDATRLRRWVEGETGTMVAEVTRPKHSKPRLMGDSNTRPKKTRLNASKATASKPMVLARAPSKASEQAEQTSGQRAKSSSNVKEKPSKAATAKVETKKQSVEKSNKSSLSKKSVTTQSPGSTVAANKSLGKKAIAKTGPGNQIAKTPYN